MPNQQCGPANRRMFFLALATSLVFFGTLCWSAAQAMAQANPWAIGAGFAIAIGYLVWRSLSNRPALPASDERSPTTRPVLRLVE